MKRASLSILSVVFKAGLLGVVLFSLQGVAVAGTGVCATATLEEPFVLPDGSEHPAGRLTLCRDGRYSPVSAMHRTFVNRMPVGIFNGREEQGAQLADDENYFMLFTRRSDRPLRLVAYSLPDYGGSQTHVLHRPRVVVKDSIDRAVTSAGSAVDASSASSASSDETLLFVPAMLD
jgi:hypothetical protein